jgi:hypothetical protein
MTNKQLYRDEADRREVYAKAEQFTRKAFAYIKSRPKSVSPLAGLTFEDPKITSAEALRVCSPQSLPACVQRELERLTVENADNPEVINAILEMQWRDNPCATARRDAKIADAKREAVALQLEGARKGYLFVDGDWVHVNDLSPFPGGLKNRYAR